MMTMLGRGGFAGRASKEYKNASAARNKRYQMAADVAEISRGKRRIDRR